MGVSEINKYKAELFSNELTDRNALLLLSVGVRPDGVVFCSRDKQMEVDKLADLLEGTAKALRAGTANKSNIITSVS